MDMVQIIEVLAAHQHAAPLVSATSALILSLGDFSNEEVKQIIKIYH
jgi:hypothetical protein